jgi:bifunctional ADP-heptose synthase (sugar kinase/adenylyltransferase)
VVAVDSDAAVRRQKGIGRPVNTCDERMEVLRALKCVDEVHKFHQHTVVALIEQMKPNIIVKGGDYEHRSFPERSYILRHDIKLIFFPRTEHSTTRTIGSLS